MAASQDRHADPSTLLVARASPTAVAAAVDAAAELRNLSRQTSRLRAAAEAAGAEAFTLCLAKMRVEAAADRACIAAQLLEETARGTDEARASRAAADVATAAGATALAALESAMQVAEAANALFQASQAAVESAADAAEAAAANAAEGVTPHGAEAVGTAAPAPVLTAAADVGEGAPFQVAAEAAEPAHPASSSPVPTPLLRTPAAADGAALTADSAGDATEMLDPLPDPGVIDDTPDAVPAGHSTGTSPAAPVLPPARDNAREEYGVEPHTLIPNPNPSEAEVAAAASPLFSQAVSGAGAPGAAAAGTAPLPVKTASAGKFAKIFSRLAQSWTSSSPGVSAGGAKAKRSGGGASSAGSHNVAATDAAAGEAQPPPHAEDLIVPAPAKKDRLGVIGKLRKVFSLRTHSASSGNADAAARAVTGRDVDSQLPPFRSSGDLSNEVPHDKVMCMVETPCGIWVLGEQLQPDAGLVRPVLSWRERMLARKRAPAPAAPQSVPDDAWDWGMTPPSWHVSTVRVRSNI